MVGSFWDYINNDSNRLWSIEYNRNQWVHCDITKRNKLVKSNSNTERDIYIISKGSYHKTLAIAKEKD